jgi:regulator of sigma E protease
MHVLNVLYVAAAVVLLFGAAIFFHEFGHFWMARRRGLKVEAFAIGFGPKILGWTRDGIDYSLRWIPAGGYVKLPQMMTSDALEGERANPTEQLPPVSPFSKILVAFAGPFMNLAFAFVIATVIYFTGLPMAINPSIIGYVEPNSPEAKMGIQEGDRIVEVDGKKVNSWDTIQTATVFARTNIIPVVIEHEGVPKTYYLTAKVSDVIGLKVLNLDPRDHPVINEVKSGSPAQKAGLKKDDEIVSVAKVPVFGQQHFVELIRDRALQPTEIIVKRNGQRETFIVTPELNPANKKGLIGAVVSSSSAVKYQVQRPGPTPWAQIADVFEKTVGTFAALVHSKQTGVGAKDLSGPVGILGILAVYVNTDYRLALSFLVLLNVNLAMINLLPLPVLDGGHIAMSLIEWVRRRPLNVKFVEYATTVFAVLLISFMLYVTFFDIKRFSLIKSLFNREMQIEKPEKGADAPASSPAPATHQP